MGCGQMKTITSISTAGPLLAATILAGCGGSADDGGAGRSGNELEAPVARIEIVQDEYHDKTVDDAYRWLEDWDSEDVKAWSDGQSATRDTRSTSCRSAVRFTPASVSF